MSGNIVAIQSICEGDGFSNAAIRTKQCREFGGFIIKLFRDSMPHLQTKTEVVYVPLLNMSSTEPDTMKTAMYYTQR